MQTREEDDCQRKALLADPKEAAEHVMLVDLARNDLGRVATAGTVRVDPYRAIERYSHVMHIVSGVQGELDPATTSLTCLQRAFPAGTLVGAPKVRAMEIIEEMEGVGRGLYAGTAGYFGLSGDMDQAITIRTLVFSGDEYSFQAGAGIVADSVPETGIPGSHGEKCNPATRTRNCRGGPVMTAGKDSFDHVRMLLIDNYDSFTYNLVQAFAAMGASVMVYRNDAITVEEALAHEPTHLVISPGPGRPDDAGRVAVHG